MKTITEQLADALRLADANATLTPCESAQVHAALAAYDAWPERMATDYRVTTEWDAFDADTPRAAELWNSAKVCTVATVCTVDGFPALVVTDAGGGAA